MQIFDTLTHLNVEEFAGEKEELELAKELGSYLQCCWHDKPTMWTSNNDDQYGSLSCLGWHPTGGDSLSRGLFAWTVDILKSSP